MSVKRIIIKEEYGTPVTLDELKEHYRIHFLSPDDFIELIKYWHNDLLIDIVLPEIDHLK